MRVDTRSSRITVPTCTGGADQTFRPDVLDANDPTQADRLGRDGQPSSCAGKGCPGGFPGTRHFQTFTFRNDSVAAACFTVTINAELDVMALAISRAPHIWAATIQQTCA